MSGAPSQALIRRQLSQLVALALCLPLVLLLLHSVVGALLPTLLFFACSAALLIWHALRLRHSLQQLQSVQQHQLDQERLQAASQLRQQEQAWQASLRTQEAQWQAQLRQAEQDAGTRLDMLAEQVPGALFQMRRADNGHLSLPWAAPTFSELFGIEPRALRDDLHALLMLFDDDARRTLEDALHSGQDLPQLDLPLQRDGQTVWRACHARAQVSDSEVIWHGFFMDATQRR